MSEWLTTREAAALLGLRDLEWVRDLLRRNGVKSRRLGIFGRVQWLADDVRGLFHVELPRVSAGKHG